MLARIFMFLIFDSIQSLTLIFMQNAAAYVQATFSNLNLWLPLKKKCKTIKIILNLSITIII